MLVEVVIVSIFIHNYCFNAAKVQPFFDTSKFSLDFLTKRQKTQTAAGVAQLFSKTITESSFPI